MELGWSFPKRKKQLEDMSADNANIEKHSFYFQNKLQKFLVHSIPVGLPKYRLENGRTLAAQAEYIGENKKEKDFFTKDTESEQAQRAQHEVLQKMLDEKGLRDFFKSNEQVEPIILTNNGYVVDGNRRLCAFRDFYESDKSKYAKFSHVRAIVLPLCDLKDIDELEAHIQIHKDIKAEYTWYTKALMLKHRQTEYAYSDEDLVNLYEMKKSEIRDLIDMLAYGEAYLNDRNMPLQYHRLKRTEYAFRQLVKCRDKINDEARKEIFQLLAFCLIDENDQGRVYESIPDVEKNLDRIVETIREDFQLEKESSKEDANEHDELLGSESTESLDDIIDTLNKEKNYDRARVITLDVIEGEKIKQKEKNKRDFVHYQLKKANSLLMEAIIAINSDTKKMGIEAQIGAIENSLEKIKEWLGNENNN